MKCQHPGVEIRLNGIEVDPCIYEEAERWENVTVTVLRCKICGHIEIEWEPQEDTRRVL